jgi:acyl carrier protein
MTTEDTLRGFLVAELNRQDSPAELTSDFSLLDVLDSVAIMVTVSFIESEFNIKVDDDEVVPSNFETLARLAAFVEAKQQARDASSLTGGG